MVRNLTVPSLTQHDLEERKNYITASDVPAIMGTSPWRTAWDVWADKCMELTPLKPSAAMLWGSMLEDDIIAFTEARLREHLNAPDLRATRVGIRRKHPNGVMSCTLDARVVDRPEAIEAKTHAVIHPNARFDQWGTEEFSDEVPPYHLDQILAQLACCPDLDLIWNPVAIRKMQPVIYCIERAKHKARIAQIEEACCDFNDQYLVTGSAPPAAPSLATVKRVKLPSDLTKVVPLEDQPLERSKELGAQIQKLTEEKEQIDAAIRAKMIGATIGASPKGHKVFLTKINRKGFEVEPTSYQRMNIHLYGAMSAK